MCTGPVWLVHKAKGYINERHARQYLRQFLYERDRVADHLRPSINVFNSTGRCNRVHLLGE